MERLATIAFVMLLVASVIGFPVLLVFTPWTRLFGRIRRFGWLGVITTATALLALILGTLCFMIVDGSWILSSWTRADRIQVAQVIVTYAGFVVAAGAGFVAAHQFRAMRRTPQLRVEWRSPLYAQPQEWTSTDPIVPALESGKSVVSLRVMNYGTRAASSVLVELVAVADDMVIKRFTLHHPEFFQVLSADEWHEELQLQSEGTHIGHLRPAHLLYPKTPEPYAYQLYLGTARTRVVETDADGTVRRVSSEISDADEREVRIRVMCAEQDSPPQELLLRLNMAEARAIYA